VTELLNQIGTATISDFTISYDGAGNRTSVSASGIGTSSLNGGAAFTYDTKNQLLEELSNRYGSFTDDFDFDSSGNPTTFRGTTKTYNSNNQPTGMGFTYDSNGNPTAYNGVSLTFDPENRLISHGSTLTAGYRGDGFRASKQTSSGTTYFLYDGSNPVVELDSNGSVIATNSFSARGLISRRVSSVSVLYTFDSEGNVAQRTDPSANVLSDHLFDAHGRSLNSSLSEPFGYKAQFGYYTDNETGLQLLTHRYYDPQTGRFLTRDPIGYAGGINVYSYVGNNPTNYADPNGLDAEALAPYVPVLIPFVPSIAAAAAAAAPYAGAAVAYGALVYGAWRFGEWTADQPWNPFTHPADPFFPPLCPPMPLARPTPTTFAPPPPPGEGDKDTQCNRQLYEVDYPTCDAIARVRGAAAYSRCIASAHQRYAACLRGQPLPPLDTWNN
jgi:RHS repeat-associated protein